MSRHTNTARHAFGFTLIEIMVALAIIGITLGALIKTSGTQASNTTYLKQKTLGHWVASNELNQLLLEQSWPSLGKTSDSTEMANHQWQWVREVEKTPSEDTRKVTFRVYSDEDLNHQVTTLVGYITNPKHLK